MPVCNDRIERTSRVATQHTELAVGAVCCVATRLGNTLSSTGMRFFVSRSEIARTDMRVDLGRLETLMAQ